jgi:hypothetical protein
MTAPQTPPPPPPTDPVAGIVQSVTDMNDATREAYRIRDDISRGIQDNSPPYTTGGR